MHEECHLSILKSMPGLRVSEKQDSTRNPSEFSEFGVLYEALELLLKSVCPHAIRSHPAGLTGVKRSAGNSQPSLDSAEYCINPHPRDNKITPQVNPPNNNVLSILPVGSEE